MTIYACQATRLPYATSDLSWWDIRQYVEDYPSGNVDLWRMFSGFYSGYYSLSQAGIGLGPAMRWIYDLVSPLLGGTRWPRKTGKIRRENRHHVDTLNLQPGELVRVKDHEEILCTI